MKKLELQSREFLENKIIELEQEVLWLRARILDQSNAFERFKADLNRMEIDHQLELEQLELKTKELWESRNDPT